MPVCMYPAVIAPERHVPNYVAQGESDSGSSVRQGSAVVPGEMIFSSGANLITGHGTYRDMDVDPVMEQSDSAKADGNVPNAAEEAMRNAPMRTSLTGRVRIVNKLVYVEPPKARYSGNVGDTVVGRIVEVEQRRWKVDVNSALYGNLALANVKLPGGELRRKSEDDERAMRSFMKEGDVIVAEVHEVYKDGTLQLHMPGTRTGKLGGGCFLRIPPSLVKRQKIHRHRLAIRRSISLPSDSGTTDGSMDVIHIGLILGCNGYVWIGPARAMDIGLGLTAAIEPAGDPLATEASRMEYLVERLAVSRVRNCVLALTQNGMPVWETSVLTACEASWFTEQPDDVEEDMEDEDEDAHQERLMVVAPTAGAAKSDPVRRHRNRIARLLRPDLSRRLVSLVQAKIGSVG
ncbi:Exosome complex exonuclease RRP4 [Fasciola hepatica]|uniref:Exosome complex exonuclease RRP4 n=1 Tax=Fasciola hepatica TaxID=6192 RepID=A0A4E0RHY4_FASHE|nr:Exosome complex exonuclease RRP4 [Fasciola hepatica]